MRHLMTKNIVLSTSMLVVTTACFSNEACDKIESLEKCIATYRQDSELTLNKQYNKAISSLPQGVSPRLKRVEILWLQYRQDTCRNLNEMDKAGCESSLTDQRTQELSIIEKRTTQGVKEGLIKFIIAEHKEKDSSSILKKISQAEPRTPAWEFYAAEHCKFLEELTGESAENCKIRLILRNWQGF